MDVFYLIKEKIFLNALHPKNIPFSICYGKVFVNPSIGTFLPGVFA